MEPIIYIEGDDGAKQHMHKGGKALLGIIRPLLLEHIKLQAMQNTNREQDHIQAIKRAQKGMDGQDIFKQIGLGDEVGGAWNPHHQQHTDGDIHLVPGEFVLPGGMAGFGEEGGPAMLDVQNQAT